MSIIDKANEYIGHPREVDEGYEVSMRRDAYAQGYQDAMNKACDWMINFKNGNGEFPLYDFVGNFRKAMLEEE